MNDDSLIEVGISNIKVGSGSNILHAILGSCVGIGFIWRKGGRCGLAHCLLPMAPGIVLQLGARYVNQAVPSLLALMGIRPHDFPDVEVVVAGGARMFSVRQNSANIGRQNTDKAIALLKENGLAVLHTDIGGRHGRQISIDCTTQNFQISRIAYQTEEFEHGTS